MIDRDKIDDGKEYSGTASAERAAFGCKPPGDDRTKDLPEMSVRKGRGSNRGTQVVRIAAGRYPANERTRVCGPAGGMGRPGGASGRRVAPRERRLSSQAGRGLF